LNQVFRASFYLGEIRRWKPSRPDKSSRLLRKRLQPATLGSQGQELQLGKRHVRNSFSGCCYWCCLLLLLLLFVVVIVVVVVRNCFSGCCFWCYDCFVIVVIYVVVVVLFLLFIDVDVAVDVAVVISFSLLLFLCYLWLLLLLWLLLCVNDVPGGVSCSFTIYCSFLCRCKGGIICNVRLSSGIFFR
jgi:hypothetical protein